MNKEEILNKVTAAVGKIKDETSPSIIRDYSISPFFDLLSGEEVGLFVVFFCGPQFVLSEGLLKYWKDQIGANDYEFKYYRFQHQLQLCLTFFVDYDKFEVKQVNLDNLTIMEEIRKCGCNPNEFDIAKHFFELGLKTQKGE